MRKYEFQGVIVCGVINFLYEMLKTAYGIPEVSYRLLLFRYTLVIAYGCYLASANYNRHKILAVVSFCIGFTVIVLIRFVGVEVPFIEYWQGTSVLGVLYLIPLASFLILNPIHNVVIETIGKASFHVYLTQKVYFAYVDDHVYEFIESRVLQDVFNIVLCSVVGIIFYYLETPISNWIMKKISAINNKTSMINASRKCR